jgi:hypothetical protein
MGKRFDHAFVHQLLESQAQRRSEDAEFCRQRNFGNSLARPEGSTEQHLP